MGYRRLAAVNDWPTSLTTIGDVVVGGGHPVMVQSMTTTLTQDVAATVAQSIRLAEAGRQLVHHCPWRQRRHRSQAIRRDFSAAGLWPHPTLR